MLFHQNLLVHSARGLLESPYGAKNLENDTLDVTPKLLLAGESEMQQLSEKEASMAISRDEAVRI